MLVRTHKHAPTVQRHTQHTDTQSDTFDKDAPRTNDTRMGVKLVPSKSKRPLVNAAALVYEHGDVCTAIN